ncbi:arsenite S-adenosylmethyltransferase [Thermoplasmatales archaeon SG8-52-4]|nr:MAG: arsenite S-adenosylmethyltransferase [Thermoplasmatales archaeon SG8-52-4]
MDKKDIKKIVKESYSEIAKGESCNCCGSIKNDKEIAKSIGYSDEEIAIASEANLGLGCGNPTAYANLKVGDIVLDLGSGAGFDAFLAAKKVGASGKVIGVDFTEDMIKKARELAKKYGNKNVEFRLGDIENLPIENESIDIIISNCVINLAPDKLKVFKEAFRVLKKTGKMYVSDIVLLEELTKEQRSNKELIAGCVGGASLKNDYLNHIKNAGFNYRILDEDKEISNIQYGGINLESLKLELSIN